MMRIKLKNNQAVKKILFITLSNLGDVVLSLPALQLLRDNYPAARIDILVGKGAAEVFANDRRVHRLIAYDKKCSIKEKFHLLKQIRGERYDIILDLRRSAFGLFGAARKHNSYMRFSRRTLHRARCHFRAAQTLVERRRLSSREPYIEISPAATQSFSNLLPDDGRPLVAVAIGSKSDLKRWPEERYALLMDRLIVHNACRLILIGDKNDAVASYRVIQKMTQKAVDLCGQTDWMGLCAILKKASLLITNDSAPLHIADHLKIPVLAIFGPTNPKKYGPRQPHSLVARREIFCSPCEKAQCRYHHECMSELSVDDVYKKCTTLLDDCYQSKNIKILLIRLDRIGDLILSLPAVSAVRERFPNAHISVMTRPQTRELIEGHPEIDEVIPYYYEKGGRHRFIIGNLRFILEIIKRRFDIAFILHPSHRSYMVPFWAGIPYRIGFKSHDWFLLTKAIEDHRSQGLKHESDYTMDIVRAFGIVSHSIELPKVPVAYEHERTIDEIFNQRGWSNTNELVVIHTDASCHSKKWPIARYQELAQKILRDTTFHIVRIGLDTDQSFENCVMEQEQKRFLDLRSQLNLKELAALLKRSRVLITNDSGPAHLAAAVECSVLSIFGRNHSSLSPRRWRPLGPPGKHRVIQKDVGCRSCMAHQCPIGFECLRAVDAGEVYSIFTQLIRGQN